MNFNVLCAALGIKPEQPVAEQLALLKHWFAENVSSDLQFSGNETEQYAQYKQVTEAYLELVLPETKQDLGKAHRKFNGANVICALAAMGFDRALLSLKPERALLNTANPLGLSPLHLAASEGYVKTTEVLLALGADSCTLNKQGQYPLFSTLMIAMVHAETLPQNKRAIFQLLKDKGTQPLNHRDASGDTILHQMVLSDFIDLIPETLEAEPTLATIKNNHALCPIHTAVLNNKIQSVTLLAKYGVDLVDGYGRTALHYAAKNGKLAAVKTLIEHEARTDLSDKQGFTLLHFAVQSGSLETVSWLLDHVKPEINAKDEEHHTPLYINEHNPDNKGNKEKISDLLREHGANMGSSITYS